MPHPNDTMSYEPHRLNKELSEVFQDDKNMVKPDKITWVLDKLTVGQSEEIRKGGTFNIIVNDVPCQVTCEPNYVNMTITPLSRLLHNG